MAKKRGWKHNARKGDTVRVLGFVAEPQVWRDARGDWHCVGKVRRDASVRIDESGAQSLTKSRRKR